MWFLVLDGGLLDDVDSRWKRLERRCVGLAQLDGVGGGWCRYELERETGPVDNQGLHMPT